MPYFKNLKTKKQVFTDFSEQLPFPEDWVPKDDFPAAIAESESGESIETEIEIIEE